MRWRQVVVLWVVATLLAAEYLLVERVRMATPAPERAPRQRLFALDAQAVEQLEIHRGGRRVVAHRDGDGWIMVEPEDAAVPGDLVRAFLAAVLEAEEIEHVAPGGKELAAFGLDERASRIELRSHGGPTQVIFIGGTNPTGTAVYARRGASSDVILVGRAIQYYEDLIFQSLPTPTAPPERGPIGRSVPLTSLARAV